MQWSPLRKFENARDKFDEAWNELFEKHVFYGSVMFNLEIIETDTVPRYATDGKQLLYNPEFVLSLDILENFTVELHEIMHVIHLHHIISAEMKLELGESYNHLRFNQAADYEINWQLRDANLPIEKHGLYDAEYHNLLLREIYFMLEDKEEEDGESDDATGYGDSDNSSSDSLVPSDDSGADDSDVDGSSDGSNSGTGLPDNSGNDPASGGSGNESDSIAGSGEIITPTSDAGDDLTSEEIKDLRHEAEKQQIVSAKFAKKQGDTTQAIDDVLSRYESAEVDWADTMREYFTDERDIGSNWNRPDKRFYNRGVTLPSRQIERIGRIVIMNDMSGSVDNALARLWQDIVNENLAQFEEIEVMIINFDDAVVGEIETLNATQFPFKLERMSWGGTDFRPPFDALIEQDFQPDFILVLTDLLCHSFPDNEPDCPVLWCEACSPRYRGGQGDPPFGETIRVRR